ncbi:hypothetical protein [Deinococcus detaillensis]|nr:hypothetical protein [Deinococcus detaillensis]
MASVRGQFGRVLGLGHAPPRLLVRYGNANPVPHSLRRPAKQVMLSG